MPIPREAFDKDLEPLDQEIIAYLRANADRAFTIEEVAAAVGADLPGPFSAYLFHMRLNTLQQRGVVVRKMLSGATYYAIAKPQK